MGPASITERAFRIFICSTFDDLKVERDALHAEIFPKLDRLCAERNFSFQAIDLRWGVSEEASLDHRTMQICLEEVSRCQQGGLRPKFLILLGDRYGWRPLPAKLAEEDYACIRESLGREARDEFEEWYPVDNNAVPPAHFLKARRVGDTPRDVERARWEEIEARLRAWISSAPLPANRLAVLLASAVEIEISKGVLNATGSNSDVGCFVRQLVDSRPIDGRFFDTDPASRERLAQLQTWLKDRVGLYRTYSARLTQSGVSTSHLKSLCDDVYRFLESWLVQEMERIGPVVAATNEPLAHEALEAELADRAFVGRADTLHALDRYFRSDDRVPRLLTGGPGSGRTHILARAIKQARTALPQARVIGRFVGATQRSARLRTLLEDLCSAISTTERHPPAALSHDLISLAESFSSRLAAVRTPLLIFIDGLDQLDAGPTEWPVTWIPPTLPPNVWLVATGCEGDLAGSVDLALPALKDHEVSSLLAAWLADIDRTLTPQQSRVVERGAKGNPLALEIAFRLAARWRSDTPVRGLGQGLPEAIETLLATLEDNALHGRLLVERCLGALSAARIGLAEDEIVELLSSDDVLRDLKKRSPKSPPVRRLPPAVWARLKSDIAPFLQVREADGAQLLAIRNPALRDTSASRYLPSTEVALARHQELASLFGGRIDPSHRRAWDGASPRGFREFPYHDYRVDDLKGVADGIVALAQDRRFRSAQFKALQDERACLETQDFALAQAVAIQDVAATLTAVEGRSLAGEALQRTVGFRLFPEIARSDPERAMAMAVSMSRQTNKTIAMTLVAWIASSDPARAPVCRRAIGQAVRDGTPIAAHQSALLLAVVRDLVESGYSDAIDLVALLPDCSNRRAAAHGWNYAPSPMLAAAGAALRRPATTSPSTNDRPVASIDAFVREQWGSGLFNVSPKQVEVQLVRKFGYDALEVAYFALAAHLIWIGDAEIAATTANRALFLSHTASSVSNGPRTRIALMQAAAASGDSMLSEEYRQQSITMVQTRRTVSHNPYTLAGLATLIDDVMAAKGGKDSRGVDVSEARALAREVGRTIEQLPANDPSNIELQLHGALRAWARGDVEAASDKTAEVAKLILAGTPNTPSLLALEAMASLAQDATLAAECARRLAGLPNAPDVRGASQRLRVYEALYLASPAQVEVVAAWLRVDQGPEALFGLLQHLAVRVADPTLIDACMGQIVRTLATRQAVRAASDAFSAQDRTFSVAQGLGVYYFRSPWVLLLSVGLLFLSLGRTAWSGAPYPIVFGVFGALGAWLDLSIWKRSKLWSRPELASRWGANAGAALGVWASIVTFQDEWPRLLSSSGVGYTTVLAGGVAFGIAAGWAIVSYRLRFTLTKILHWGAAGLAVAVLVGAGLAASNLVRERLGPDVATGCVLGGSLLLALGINVLVKSIRVRRHYAARGTIMDVEAGIETLVDEDRRRDAPRESPATSKILRAQEARRKGRPKAARDLYSAAIEDPTFRELSAQSQSSAFLMRGMTNRELGDPLAALEDYSGAIRLRASSPSAYMNSALVLAQELRDSRRSIVMFNTCIERDPTAPDAYSSRGIVKAELGDDEGALKDYDIALDLDPRHADAMVNKANLLLKRGDPGRAIALWDESLAIRPDAPVKKFRDHVQSLQ